MKKILSAFLIVFVIITGLTMCTSVEPEPEPEQIIEQPEPVQTAEPEPVIQSEPEEFVVSEELYVETFGNIKLLIENLNGIIAGQDYDTWLTYLTSDYIEYYSDPEQLMRFSELYKQRGYNQRINDFEDYFKYVVVMSRKNAVLDEINFTDSTHITAFTEIKEQLSVLYYLEKNENNWKIGLKPEN